MKPMSKNIITILLTTGMGVLALLGLNALGFRFPALVSYGIVGFVSGSATVLFMQKR